MSQFCDKNSKFENNSLFWDNASKILRLKNTVERSHYVETKKKTIICRYKSPVFNIVSKNIEKIIIYNFKFWKLYIKTYFEENKFELLG